MKNLFFKLFIRRYEYLKHIQRLRFLNKVVIINLAF